MIILMSTILSSLIYLIIRYKMNLRVADSPVQLGNYSPYHKPLAAGLHAQISKRLEVWVESHGYTQNGITINDIAVIAATNRTYLSKYVNTTHGCSFRVWVNRLRIERAKELLLDDEVSIDEVSREVGYASYNSFIHSFRRYEGCSISQWRREQWCGLSVAS